MKLLLLLFISFTFYAQSKAVSGDHTTRFPSEYFLGVDDPCAKSKAQQNIYGAFYIRSILYRQDDYLKNMMTYGDYMRHYKRGGVKPIPTNEKELDLLAKKVVDHNYPDASGNKRKQLINDTKEKWKYTDFPKMEKAKSNIIDQTRKGTYFGQFKILKGSIPFSDTNGFIWETLDWRSISSKGGDGYFNILNTELQFINSELYRAEKNLCGKNSKLINKWRDVKKKMKKRVIASQNHNRNVYKTDTIRCAEDVLYQWAVTEMELAVIKDVVDGKVNHYAYRPKAAKQMKLDHLPDGNLKYATSKYCKIINDGIDFIDALWNPTLEKLEKYDINVDKYVESMRNYCEKNCLKNEKRKFLNELNKIQGNSKRRETTSKSNKDNKSINYN